MLVIGIVGGIASGKSLVAKMFEDLGACLIRADQIGHEVLKLNETIHQIRDAWGDRVLDETGNVDRRKVAEIVFHNATELRKLEQITHPKIEARIRQQLREIPENAPAAVLDAPILIKAGWDRFCDRLVFVECPRAVRLDRSKSSRGWSTAMFEAREAAQLPVEEKRKRATDVIDNAQSIDQLRPQVVECWERWGLTPVLDQGSR